MGGCFVLKSFKEDLIRLRARPDLHGVFFAFFGFTIIKKHEMVFSCWNDIVAVETNRLIA